MPVALRHWAEAQEPSDPSRDFPIQISGGLDPSREFPKSAEGRWVVSLLLACSEWSESRSVGRFRRSCFFKARLSAPGSLVLLKVEDPLKTSFGFPLKEPSKQGLPFLSPHRMGQLLRLKPTPRISMDIDWQTKSLQSWTGLLGWFPQEGRVFRESSVCLPFKAKGFLFFVSFFLPVGLLEKGVPCWVS